jgi:plasmid stabilization system protein ParE
MSAHERDQEQPMFTPNKYKLVLPIKSTEQEGARLGNERARLFLLSKEPPQSIKLLQIQRVNSDDPISSAGWRTGEIERVPELPAFTLPLEFDAGRFEQQIEELATGWKDREHKLEALRAQHRELAAIAKRRLADCGDHTEQGATEAQKELLTLREAIDKLAEEVTACETEHTAQRNLRRAFVVGATLHFLFEIDRTRTSLFVEVSHRMLAKKS